MVNQLPTHCQPWPTHCQPIANHGRLPSPSVPSSSVRPRGMEAPRAGQPAYSRCCQHDPTAASTCIVRRAHSARGMALGNGAPKQWGPTGPSAALVPFLHPPYSCQRVHRATRALCTGDGLGRWSAKAMEPHRAVSRACSVPVPSAAPPSRRWSSCPRASPPPNSRPSAGQRLPDG